MSIIEDLCNHVWDISFHKNTWKNIFGSWFWPLVQRQTAVRSRDVPLTRLVWLSERFKRCYWFLCLTFFFHPFQAHSVGAWFNGTCGSIKVDPHETAENAAKVTFRGSKTHCFLMILTGTDVIQSHKSQISHVSTMSVYDMAENIYIRQRKNLLYLFVIMDILKVQFNLILVCWNETMKCCKNKINCSEC